MCLWAGLRLHGTSQRVIKSCYYHAAIFLIKWKYWSSLWCGNFIFGTDICIFTACVYNWTVLFSSRVEKWQVFTYRSALLMGTIIEAFHIKHLVVVSDSCSESLLFMASASWRFLCANRCHHVLIARECFLWFGGNAVLPVCWGWPWEWY